MASTSSSTPSSAPSSLSVDVEMTMGSPTESENQVFSNDVKDNSNDNNNDNNNDNSNNNNFLMSWRQVFHDGMGSFRNEIGSFLTCFTGISIVAYLHFECSSSYYTKSSYLIKDMEESHVVSTPPLLLVSFGAAAILLFGQIDAPLAQPRNAFFGQILSAICGVIIKHLFSLGNPNQLLWLQCSLAVSIALTVMQLTKCVHPPGGATALYAVVGGPAVYNLGFWYVLSPVGIGTVILIAVSLLLQSPVFGRKYPAYWWTKGS